MLPLDGTPYVLSPEADEQLSNRVIEIEERVALLRSQGRMTEENLRRFYGKKRFEQVAESNAIEGSTLDVGETQIAILKGITITGHDPAYVRDAQSLDRALSHAVELATSASRCGG